MGLDNMVTDGSGKLENNWCMFKQPILPITHTIWSINYSFPVFGAKMLNSTTSLTMLIPEISVHSCSDLNERNTFNDSEGSQYTNCLRSSCSLEEGQSSAHTHAHLFRVLLLRGYERPLGTRGTPKLAWHFQKILIAIHC